MKAEKFDLKNVKILIAEDNSYFSEMLIDLLGEVGGAEVKAVTTGQDAVIAASREQFDIVLMDLTLPILDGVSAAKLIRQTKPSLPIIALSGRLGAGDRVPDGFDLFLSKPFSMDKLFNSILSFSHKLKLGADQAS